MENPQIFRSAFNGFNREDVVHYIEYLNAQHTSQIHQLESQLELLRSREEAAPAQEMDETLLSQQAARIRELFDRCTALEQERDELRNAAAAEPDTAPLDALRAENSQLQEQLHALQIEHVRLQEKFAAAQQEAAAAKNEDELQAYRRAERMERVAQERTQQMYRQANAALSEASVRVDTAAEEIVALSDRVMEQLENLRNAVCSGKNALTDASATMYAIRPNDDN